MWTTWGVDVKTYPAESEFEEDKVYAFVADLFGRVYVFDVSASQIFPAVQLPYLPYSSTPPQPPPSAPILTPMRTITFMPEPADGLAPNCVDIEIDEEFAYVALAKGGVAILDLSVDPALASPTLVDVMDTPGVAVGVTFRRILGVATHLVVGDTRCGMRLYGKSGP